MVDSRTTEHVINDKSKFINFDPNFVSGNHFVELANDSQVNNIVLKRGDTWIYLQDSNG